QRFLQPNLHLIVIGVNGFGIDFPAREGYSDHVDAPPLCWVVDLTSTKVNLQETFFTPPPPLTRAGVSLSMLIRGPYAISNRVCAMKVSLFRVKTFVAPEPLSSTRRLSQ